MVAYERVEGIRKQNVLRQIRRTTEKPPTLAKKYVETYSSSNAAEQYSEERAKLTQLQRFTKARSNTATNVQQKFWNLKKIH